MCAIAGTSPESGSRLSREAAYALLYFALYLAYLFARLESELLHWVSLVLLPTGLVFCLRRWESRTTSLESVLASFGLRKGNLTQGLLGASLVGLALSLVQLLGSRSRLAIYETFSSGRFVYMLPLSLGLMLLTAGFTEEFFFRGLLQTRLRRWCGSHLAAVLITSLLFGLYHLPYAYLNPRWPSHGDWASAFRLALGQGVPGGLILGWVYARSRDNLLGCVVTHALINTLPAMQSIRFG